MRRYKDRRGVTLVELMVATAVISVGILGFFGAFRFITRSLYISRTRTLATNLAQEKIEVLKNLTYYELAITTAPQVDNSVSPGVLYDTVQYPAEVITIGGITFRRYTYIALAQVDNDSISTVTFTFPDTGLKQLTVNVLWNDGGTTKKWSLTNLLENPNINPLDTGISGDVKMQGTSAVLSGVQVRIDEDPDWNATTASNGTYSFRVYHGSYTVRASSAGFYDNVSSILDAEPGVNLTVPTIFLTQIATGTVKGNAWLSPDVVVAGVSVSTKMAGQNNFEAQYIELFNPTTSAINIGVTGSNPSLKVNYRTATGCSNFTDCSDSSLGIKLTYISTYVAPSHYYLVANTNTFTVNGTLVTADAVYTDDANGSCSSAPPGSNWNLGSSPRVKKLIVEAHGGSVWLSRGSTIVDAVGWQHNGNNPPYYEGTFLTITGNAANGFPINEQIVRISSPMPNLAQAGMDTYGRAYDSGNNNEDFAYDPAITSLPYAPGYTGSGAKTVIAGVPAVGAVVTSSDPYSGSTVAAAAYISSGALTLLYAPYVLPGITTGTWQITIASGSAYNQYSPVTITQNVGIGIPNAATSPSWPVANNYSAFLTTGALAGFVKGQVTDISNRPLSGIVVTAGGVKKTTGANGSYFIATATGSIAVIANPYSDPGFNSHYVQSQIEVTVPDASIITQDFTLTKGGVLQGYMTSGTTPLPNYVVSATINGSQYAQATSNSSGYFSLRNLSTGTYTVGPVLETGQDSTPTSVDATVLENTTVFVGSFTILGALGGIVGSVTYNGSALTTGGLLVASTAAISSPPTTLVASSAPAQVPIYAVSTKADGSFNLPVRGSNTYYLTIFVPSISGASVSSTIKSYSGIYVSPNVDTHFNLTVP